MTTRVPFVPTQPPTWAVQGGRGVSGATWAGASEQINYLLGHGAQVIPAAHVPITIAAGGSKDIRYRVVLPYSCTTLLWVIAVRSTHATLPAAVAITTPTSGSAVTYYASNSRGGPPIRHIQQVTAKSGTVQEISMRVAPTLQTIELDSIACVAMPRASLLKNSDDNGIDAASQNARQPIYAAASASGLSLSQLAQTGATCLTRARRNGLFHLPLPDNTTDAISVTGATTLYGLAGPIGATPVLTRKLYSTSTTGTVTVEVLAWASTGLGDATYGTVTSTPTSGATLTVNLGTVGTPLTTTKTWYSATVAADCEDLTATDGRRSTRWDDMLWDATRTAGAETIYVATISGYEA